MFSEQTSHHSPLLPVLRRIAHAETYLVRLTSMVRNYIQKNPVRIEAKINGEYTDYEFVLFRDIPDGVHLLVADVVHNLKASLDNTISIYAGAKGKRKKQLFFPFPEDDRGLEGKFSKYFPWFDDDVKDEIRRTSPYEGGNIYFYGLNEIDNADKHGDPIAVPAGARSNRTRFVAQDGTDIEIHPTILWPLSGNRMTFFRYINGGRCTIEGPKEADASILLPGELKLGYEDVVGYLAQSVQHTRYFVQRMDEIFERRAWSKNVPKPSTPADPKDDASIIYDTFIAFDCGRPRQESPS